MVGDFILRGVIVPLAHDSFGGGVVQRGEGVVRQLANQVRSAIDFKGVKLDIGRGHGLDCCWIVVGLFAC